MGENQFKPGDKIITREVSDYRPLCGAGKTLTVKRATDYACRWGVLYTFVEVTHGVYSSGMELVEPTLDEELVAAKAEVKRIEGLIAERDAPKAGKAYKNTGSNTEAVVLEVSDGSVFFKYRKSPQGSWEPMKRSLTSFIELYEAQ